MKQAIFYCKLHEALACFGCKGENHSRCRLLLINDIGPSQGMDSEICTNNEKINLLKKRLRKLDFERENDQRKLSLSIDSSKRNITAFTSDLHNLLNDQIDTMFKEIGQRETDQSVHISGCREICRLLNQSLDTKKEILLKSRGTNNSISTFVTHVKVAKF